MRLLSGKSHMSRSAPPNKRTESTARTSAGVPARPRRGACVAFDNNMKRRPIPLLTPESLANMPTKQLLGRLLSLQQCEESAALADRTPAGAAEGIVFKNTVEWQKAYADLEVFLATREHVPSAVERAECRHERGQVSSERKSKPTAHRASRFAQRQNRTSSAADSRH